MTAADQNPSAIPAPHVPQIRLNTAAQCIYDSVRDLAIISPHGHTDPKWFATNAAFANPTELLITPDHYVFRMLYSQGVSMDDLGLNKSEAPKDPRAVFRIFAAHWHKFRGTPSHLWISHSLAHVFGVDQALSPASADAIYDHIDAALKTPDLRPQSILKRFNVDVLATTDGALDDLAAHADVARQGIKTAIIPTFRPDTVINPARPSFRADVARMGAIAGEDSEGYDGYLAALIARRAHFKAHGATATDHDVPDMMTQLLEPTKAAALFSAALRGVATPAEQKAFHAHMLVKMAEMSAEDGLTMQIHAGVRRSTNHFVRDRYGADMGADIPVAIDYTRGLEGLLNRVGNTPGMRVLAFTLDETGYARELAPMAGHWPALRLGPPWWFHDSLAGITRFLDQVVETAGYWNLAGFNDDTRALMSIPARHDVWRRAVSLHLAGQIDKGLLDQTDAIEIATLLTRDLAVAAYKLDPALCR